MKKLYFGMALLALNGFAQHEGHDHGAHDHESKTPAGVELKTASGGLVERLAVFPAEIKLNRDRLAAVSARYAGTVLEMKANPGDTVVAGSVLAVLQNRETLAVYSLTSPLAGTVISKGGSAGETVGEGTVLYEVADLSSVWVEVHVFPQYHRVVRKGIPVVLTANNEHAAKTEIDYVNPVVSPETRTLLARCVLNNPEKYFTPGAFVRVQIAVESVQAAVRVEKEAVQMMNGESIVFIKDADGIEPRDVQTGLADDSFVEIRSGLEAGETYVAQGAFDLKAELVTSGLDPHAGHGH